jgi:demethylmenaquinone methyltransferase/2-methoxy-6-polyprenyl-1,4-benzoquinol methylase
MQSSAVDARPRTPQTVFDRVAPYYDTLNSILSFGMDRRWRRRTVASLRLRPGARVLDVATGTGALATEIARATSGLVSVTGCDLNERMLSIARLRTTRARARVELVCCDATSLPFPEESFDSATIGFAIDDMPDRDACMREVWRVLRPGGQVALLELSQPDAGPFRAVYRLYLRTFRIFSRGPEDGYAHLEQEILKYRGAGAIEELFARGGFTGYSRTSLTWGIARLHVAEKAGPFGAV